MILFLSDFDLTSSGYMQIAISMCSELAARGRKVMALGIGYKHSEHDWPFSILPVDERNAMAFVPAMLRNLQAIAAAGQLPTIEALVVALDIPLQEQFLQLPRTFPYIGVFPVESGPVCASWANAVSRMEAKLVISQFGQRELKAKGVEATYLPVGLDTKSWRLATQAERASLRKAMGFDDGELVVLTVADNQERKNLYVAAKAVADLNARNIPTTWLLVTRVNSPVGWKLDDMAADLGISKKLMKFERGLAFDRLWTLHAIADAFLLTSKAEGLCVPILEAMASGVPVVATQCTAVTEHLYVDPPQATPPISRRLLHRIMGSGMRWRRMRGLPIEVEFSMNDPWGNSFRSIASSRSAADRLAEVYKGRGKPWLNDMIERARTYAETRTHAAMGDVLDAAISRVIADHQPTVYPGPARTPNTVPSLVPVQEGSES